MREQVVLAFSGGIDSTTAAGLLRQQWDVCALTLDITSDARMLERARERAAELGISFAIKDVKAEFQRSVIDYFTKSYGAGRTPAPCTLCNPLIKWRFLVEYADEIGVEHIATGHYFNIEQYNGHYYVARADDSRKDQSYYLWGLSQATLARALTPMGHVIKEQIRQGFADKRESMGLCFLQGRSYRDFITSSNPEMASRGEIVDCNGRLVGHHDGVAFYTIGQKRGFECELSGVAIVAIDAEHNRLVVGEDALLHHLTLEISNCNIIDKEEFTSATDIEVVIRGIGRNPEGYARLIEPTREGYRIHLENPAWAAAAGQPVVFYRQNRVIGGGIVERYY